MQHCAWLLLALWLAAACSPTNPPNPRGPVGAAPTTTWPQLAADPERDGQSAASVTSTQLTPMYWQHFFAPEVLSPQAEPIINNSLLYIGTEYRHVYAFTLTGTQSWSFTAAGAVESAVGATANAVYFTDMSGAMYALNPTTGVQLWKRQLTTRLGCNTAVLMDDNTAPTHVIAGCRDGNLYAVDPTPTGTGAILWTYNAGAPLLSAPASHGGLAYVVSNDLYLHAVCIGPSNCGTTAPGAAVWKSAKLGGIASTAYYPIVVPEPSTTTYRVVVRTWPVTSFNVFGEPMFPNDFTTATQSSLLSTIQANPSNYRPNFIVFANDGTSNQQPLGLECYECQTMHGPSWPGCLDKNGYLVVTSRGAPNSGKDSGWAEYNIATGQYVSWLQNTASPSDGYGNRDENLTGTCTANGFFGTHIMEGNANFTGFFDMTSNVWTNLTLSLNIQGVGTTAEGNGGNATAVAAGIAAHNAMGVITVRKTQ